MDALARRPIPARTDPHRSRMLSAVRGKGNATTELLLAGILRQSKLPGWRRHLPLPGRPDFAWPRLKVTVFVDGCFWHGCPRCYQAPKHNAAFWREKVEGNRRRDRRVRWLLRAGGWTVLRIWECRVGQPGTLSRLRRALSAADERT